MAKPKKKKEIVFLVCAETGERNYTIRKKPGTPKLGQYFLSSIRSRSFTRFFTVL